MSRLETSAASETLDLHINLCLLITHEQSLRVREKTQVTKSGANINMLAGVSTFFFTGGQIIFNILFLLQYKRQIQNLYMRLLIIIIKMIICAKQMFFFHETNLISHANKSKEH